MVAFKVRKKACRALYVHEPKYQVFKQTLLSSISNKNGLRFENIK